MIVYVSIGNSDDKLSQSEWAHFVAEVRDGLAAWETKRHGEWLSAPDSPWQNACWCVEVFEACEIPLKRRLATIADSFGQDSIAWAQVAETEFIGAAT